MVRRPAPSILEMKSAGIEHFIERTYREGGTFQWVRETLINSMEAQATRIEFGIEWQAVSSVGVYRRTIADNGTGMTPSQMVEFFNTFGGGGKPIGGVHENFGVGAKTTLLPWNKYGIVVVSWVDGEASMIWLKWDAEANVYGLRLFTAMDDETGETSLDEVVEPFDDEEHGCDWRAIKPEWVKSHGTVIVLLGNSPDTDTVLGDPTRDESDIKGISTYLNRRFWEIPKDREVKVDELRTSERNHWPRSDEEAYGPQAKRGIDRRTNTRAILGANYYITYPEPKFKTGKCAASDTVILSDGAKVDWFLWDGERPAVQSYAAISGFIAAEYRNELYNITDHAATYRSFGLNEKKVRSRTWLIIRPPEAHDQKHGVYPRTDRNALLLKGGPSAGEPLPISDWAAEFADLMPGALREALRDARSGDEGSITDTSWRDRLAERFGSRWRIAKLRISKSGAESVDPAQLGTSPGAGPIAKRKKRNGTGGGGGGRTGQASVGSAPGSAQAKRVKIAGGIPIFLTVPASAFDTPGMLAAWMPHHPEHPEGAVLLNIEHPVLLAEIEHWQSRYADHHAENIRQEVVRVYGELAVARVAHSEHLKGLLPSKVVDEDLRSEAALTMSLLGLLAEDAVIATRVGGRYGRQSQSVVA